MSVFDRPQGIILSAALSLVLAGWFIGNGFARGRADDRYVEVKGLSEREVNADVALWPLRFAASGNELPAVQQQVVRHTADVLAFLKRNGIDSGSVEVRELDVFDANAERYAGSRPGPRFIIQQTVMVRSGNPGTVLAASQRVGELVSAGVVLSSGREFGYSGPTYMFTQLNSFKPEMIAEATANARAAAEQFARDSRSKLGKIKIANQGVFVIMARDQAPGVNEANQIQKTVRVVSTIQYFLR